MSEKTDALATAQAKVERLEAEAEAYNAILCELSGGLDNIDAAADRWLELLDVQRMARAITSVFSKWANDDIMDRFHEKVVALMHQAFVEGAVSAGAVHAKAAESLQSENARLKALLKALLEEAVEVLKPFADIPTGRESLRDAAEIEIRRAPEPLEYSVGQNVRRARLLMCEFRRASAFLSKIKGEVGEG